MGGSFDETLPSSLIEASAQFLRKRFPLVRWCAACEAETLDSSVKNLCEECAKGLPYWLDQICPLCLGRHAVCPFNADWKLEKVHAVFRYEATVARLVRAFKYAKNPITGRILAEAARSRKEKNDLGSERFDWIMPVPSTRRKVFFRGFNPSALLAKWIFEGKGEPAILMGRKIKKTPEQASLKRGDRLRSYRGKAFAIDRDLTGKNVLVFDDVMTTGTTVRSFVKEIRRKGAKRTALLILARNAGNG